MRAKDFFVFLAITALLQRIADHARFGYWRYLTGTIKSDKAEQLVDKFIRLYHVDLNHLSAYRQRKRGKAVGRLFFWKCDDTRLNWLLMLSNGSYEIETNEKWRNLKQDKIKIRVHEFNYELYQEAKDGKTVWTWRVNREDYNTYLNEGLGIIKHGSNDLLRPMIRKISSDFLGFSGSRSQAKKANDLFKKTWININGNKEPPHPFPEKFFYVRRVKDRGTTLRKLLAKSER